MLHLVQPQRDHSAVREGGRASLVSLALRGVRELEQRRLHRRGRQPASAAAGRISAEPRRPEGFLRRLQLYLGVGEQPHPARGDRPERRHGRRRALFSRRLHRVRPSHRRDPRRAPVVRLQHANRRVLLPVPARSARRLPQPRASIRRARFRSQAVRCPSPNSPRSDPTAVDGHITSSVYFSSLDTPENDRFVQAYRARFPEGPVVSADAEATYLAVRLLARAVAEAGAVEAVAPSSGPSRCARSWRRRARSASTPRRCTRPSRPASRCSNAGRRLHDIARSAAARGGRSLSHPQFVALRRRGHPARPASRLMTTHRLIQNFRRSQGLALGRSRFQRRTCSSARSSSSAYRSTRVEQIERRGARSRSRHRVSRRRSADQSRAAARCRARTSRPRRLSASSASRRRAGSSSWPRPARPRSCASPSRRDGLFRAVSRREQSSGASSRPKRGSRSATASAAAAAFSSRPSSRSCRRAVLSDEDAYAELRRESMRRRSRSRGVLRSPVRAGQRFPGRVARRRSRFRVHMTEEGLNMRKILMLGAAMAA